MGRPADPVRTAAVGNGVAAAPLAVTDVSPRQSGSARDAADQPFDSVLSVDVGTGVGVCVGVVAVTVRLAVSDVGDTRSPQCAAIETITADPGCASVFTVAFVARLSLGPNAVFAAVAPSTLSS